MNFKKLYNEWKERRLKEKTRTVLSLSQIAALECFYGFEIDPLLYHVSCIWVIDGKDEYYTDISDMEYEKRDNNKIIVPTFSFEDIIDIMPFYIETDEREKRYFKSSPNSIGYNGAITFYMHRNPLPLFQNKPIDAAFNLLCWFLNEQGERYLKQLRY